MFDVEEQLCTSLMYFFSPVLFWCVVGLGPHLKSEVPQSQSKLHPRPSQVAWTDFHPASDTGTGRCGK